MGLIRYNRVQGLYSSTVTYWPFTGLTPVTDRPSLAILGSGTSHSMSRTDSCLVLRVDSKVFLLRHIRQQS